MLGNESLWDVATQCHAILDRAAIPHAILGGVAVCLHGYERNTVDVDMLIGVFRRDCGSCSLGSVRLRVVAGEFRISFAQWNSRSIPDRQRSRGGRQ